MCLRVHEHCNDLVILQSRRARFPDRVSDTFCPFVIRLPATGEFSFYRYRLGLTQKHGYSPCCNAMVDVCSRREFIYEKGKLGPCSYAPFEKGDGEEGCGQKLELIGDLAGGRVEVRGGDVE